MLTHNMCFSDSRGQVIWQGKRNENNDEFHSFLSGPVRARLIDEEHSIQYELDLRALAITDMSSETIIKLLASEPSREPWEVGEALAECLLQDEYGVKWPWNTERDKRTPRASLPGADLVGFFGEGEEALLLLGEVKTSSDSATPPQVMNGRSGMVHQLDELACNISIHNCLLKWLHARCKNTEFWPVYQKAVQKYLTSSGTAIKLVGMLMRDTSPNELDLKNRALSLADNLSSPTEVDLNAWYFPSPIAEWPPLAQGGNV